MVPGRGKAFSANKRNMLPSPPVTLLAVIMRSVCSACFQTSPAWCQNCSHNSKNMTKHRSSRPDRESGRQSAPHPGSGTHQTIHLVEPKPRLSTHGCAKPSGQRRRGIATT
jgi:hypothetical protein